MSKVDPKDLKGPEVDPKDPEVDPEDPEFEPKDPEVDSKSSTSFNVTFKAPIIPKIISSKKLVATDDEVPKKLEKNKMIFYINIKNNSSFYL